MSCLVLMSVEMVLRYMTGVCWRGWSIIRGWIMDDMFVHCLLMPSDYGGSLLNQFVDSVGVAWPQQTDRKSLAYEFSFFRK